MADFIGTDGHTTPNGETGRRFGNDPFLYLDPDEEDLRHATYILLKPCPFCGAGAGPPISKYQTESRLYQTVVGCRHRHCGVEIRYNGHTRNEARTMAIERWQNRLPANER